MKPMSLKEVKVACCMLYAATIHGNKYGQKYTMFRPPFGNAHFSTSRQMFPKEQTTLPDLQQTQA